MAPKQDKELPEYFQKYLDDKFETLSEEIKEIRKILEGNGKPGLIKRVSDLEGLKVWVVGAVIGGTTVVSFIWDNILEKLK